MYGVLSKMHLFNVLEVNPFFFLILNISYYLVYYITYTVPSVQLRRDKRQAEDNRIS